MPNVLLTQKCGRACPYCFAATHMHQSPPADIISWENLIYIVDFLQRAGEDHISLLGGEPLLHPYVGAIVKYLSLRGFSTTLFTSGICSTEARARLKSAIKGISPEKVSFVVNYNDPQLSSRQETESVDRFFEEFSSYVSLGVNVYRLGFDYTYPVKAIREFGLQPLLRLGLAHPIADTYNQCLYPDENIMCRMASELDSAIEVIAGAGIKVFMDCGFPRCAFSDEQAERLYRNFEKVNFQCGSAIDIGPDLMVWNCFPLSGVHSKSLLEFNSYDDVKDYFKSVLSDIRKTTGGIYPHCVECHYYHAGHCGGGCISHGINRYKRNSNSIIDERI